jgi:tubulin-specific chaperone E
MNAISNDIIEKKVPLRMSVQTLYSIVHKLFANIQHSNTFNLYYIDAKKKNIRVAMDNLSKSLDYYSIQENDLVLIDIQ